jgi:hypothetical protein
MLSKDLTIDDFQQEESSPEMPSFFSMKFVGFQRRLISQE